MRFLRPGFLGVLAFDFSRILDAVRGNDLGLGLCFGFPVCLFGELAGIGFDSVRDRPPPCYVRSETG